MDEVIRLRDFIDRQTGYVLNSEIGIKTDDVAHEFKKLSMKTDEGQQIQHHCVNRMATIVKDSSITNRSFDSFKEILRALLNTQIEANQYIQAHA